MSIQRRFGVVCAGWDWSFNLKSIKLKELMVVNIFLVSIKLAFLVYNLVLWSLSRLLFLIAVIWCFGEEIAKMSSSYADNSSTKFLWNLKNKQQCHITLQTKTLIVTSSRNLHVGWTPINADAEIRFIDFWEIASISWHPLEDIDAIRWRRICLMTCRRARRKLYGRRFIVLTSSFWRCVLSVMTMWCEEKI